MLNTIHQHLNKWGLASRYRTVCAQFSNQKLNDEVFIQSVYGEHHLNQGLRYELLCLSTNDKIALKAFIGTQVAVDVVTDRGQLSRLTGVVTGASQGSSDGALCVYKLIVQDAFALLKQSRNSCVFLNKTIIEITQNIFKLCAEQSQIFAHNILLDYSGITRNYDIRPFTMMYNEDYYHFLTRLWRSEGVNWLVAEHEAIVKSSSDEMQPQRLKLIDDNHHFPELARGKIRFHSRSHAAEQSDSITELRSDRKLSSTHIHIQRWFPENLKQDQDQVLSGHHKHSENLSNEQLNLEQVWNIAPAWLADLDGKGGSTKANFQQLDRLNQQLLDYQNLQAKSFVAKGSVRDADVGSWFELNGHSELDQHDLSDRRFIIMGKKSYQQNNLPKDLKNQLDHLLDMSQWQYLKASTDEMQGTELNLVRYSIKIVPEYDFEKHRPYVYPMRATVVGPSTEEIYVDAWGNVKVRFPFTRVKDHHHSSGAGTNDNEGDSAWLPVMTPWAGSSGEGMRFHPRIGDGVIINFMEGDIDRPYVEGRIYESQHIQTNFDLKGSLPETKKLSGIRSKEVSGSGYNQLRFDDSTGQISAQLQSSHAATQLNLGNLSHPKESEKSNGRGEGFELRTDAYGAVRAGKGMLLTTYAQEQAIADHLDAVQAQKLLDQAHNSMNMLSDVAVKQQTDALNVIKRLPKLIKSLEIKTKSQAINIGLNLFKDNLTTDPLDALKGCGGFIGEMSNLGAGGIIEEFNQYFGDVKGAVDNLKGFIENVEDFGVECVKKQLKNIKNEALDNPFTALSTVGKALANISLDDFNLSNITGALTGGSNGLTKLLGNFQSLVQGFGQELQEAESNSSNKSNGTLFRQALMLLASPNGIAMTTPEDILAHASQEIGLSSGGSTNVSSQKNIVMHAQDKASLFAVNKGINIYAAKEDIKLQAQDGMIEAIAKKVVEIISAEDWIRIKAAKGIAIESQGNGIYLDEKGITFKSHAGIYYHAAQHVFKGAMKVSLNVPALPRFNKNNWIDIAYMNEEDEPFVGTAYKIFFENNKIIQGKLDKEGKAHHENVPDNAIKVEYENNAEEDPAWASVEDVLDILNSNNNLED